MAAQKSAGQAGSKFKKVRKDGMKEQIKRF